MQISQTNVYAGGNPSSAADLIGELLQEQLDSQLTCTQGTTTAEGLWGQNAQGITFSAIGNVTYTLTGGNDYSAGVQWRW